MAVHGLGDYVGEPVAVRRGVHQRVCVRQQRSDPFAPLGGRGAVGSVGVQVRQHGGEVATPMSQPFPGREPLGEHVEPVKRGVHVGVVPRVDRGAQLGGRAGLIRVVLAVHPVLIEQPRKIGLQGARGSGVNPWEAGLRPCSTAHTSCTEKCVRCESWAWVQPAALRACAMRSPMRAATAVPSGPSLPPACQTWSLTAPSIAHEVTVSVAPWDPPPLPRVCRCGSTCWSASPRLS